MPANLRPSTSGNTADDWRVFEVLCGAKNEELDTTCGSTGITLNEHHHTIDVATTLRSELAALSYKKERLTNEFAEVKSLLCAKDSECENLRAQAARQSALIASLQNRLQAAEHREQSVQARCDSTIDTIKREKRNSDERNKELICKIQHFETHVSNEESQKEQIKAQMHDMVRRLAVILGLDVSCESVNSHMTPDCVLVRAEEVMVEWQRAKAKVNATCDTLSSCENELLNLKSLANIEKQRLTAQLEGAGNHNHELEGRCRQYERDLQIQRDRLTESEINAEKMKEELRGFESRCHRLQNNLDRIQGDRLQFLRTLANQLNVPEPCETLIKDRLREVLSENQQMHAQTHTLRDQLNMEHEKLKEAQVSTECKLRNEEAHKNELEDRLEKCHAEIHTLRKDHMGLSEFLQRLASALNWSECSAPPALGADTNLTAENLLERAERLAAHCDHELGSSSHHHHHHNHRHDHRHDHSPEKGCCEHTHGKLRRERSCHDLPLKESSSVYNLQRRVRILREQVQRRDLHLELLRRKLAIIEDGARGKCVLQGERDEAVCRAKKATKQIDKLTAQLSDARTQIAEVKAQLAEAVEYKITSLERARKIDELTTQICDLEDEKTRLLSQLCAMKERVKSSCESNQNRRSRDEALITSLRDDLNRLQAQFSDANHRLSHLQSFRTSVARTLHLRDLPETDLLHRLQALCSAQQEFTLLSKRFETVSPGDDHPCPRYDDSLPPSAHCHPTRDANSPPPYHHKLTDLASIDLHGKTHHNQHHNHNRNYQHRQRSKSREKRLHDECFDSDVHRHHCKEDLLGGGCDDNFNYKGKYC